MNVEVAYTVCRKFSRDKIFVVFAVCLTSVKTKSWIRHNFVLVLHGKPASAKFYVRILFLEPSAKFCPAKNSHSTIWYMGILFSYQQQFLVGLNVLIGRIHQTTFICLYTPILWNLKLCLLYCLVDYTYYPEMLKMIYFIYIPIVCIQVTT